MLLCGYPLRFENRKLTPYIPVLGAYEQTGGLLSDVFLHLVPHSFMGEHQDNSAHFVMVEEKRNILVG